jgi:hypothetical protein
MSNTMIEIFEVCSQLKLIKAIHFNSIVSQPLLIISIDMSLLLFLWCMTYSLFSLKLIASYYLKLWIFESILTNSLISNSVIIDFI